MDCHFKEKVVLWPSFLYKGNFYTGKAPLRIAIGPPYIIDISEDEISMVVYNPPPPPKKKKKRKKKKITCIPQMHIRTELYQ